MQIQAKNFWFQFDDNLENHCLDLKDFDNTLKVTQNVDYIFNFACNMGGMGFIENNKAEYMLSVLVNTNLLRSAKENNCEKYFPQAPVFIMHQNKKIHLFQA